MIVWRLARKLFAPTPAEAYNGTGARLGGGRWNSRTIAMAYASENAALAFAEYFANLPQTMAPTDLQFFPALVPDDCILPSPTLPTGWDAVPAGFVSAHFGDEWIASRASLALIVPSVLVPNVNILINPAHDDFQRIVFQQPIAFTFDQRFIAKSAPA